MGCVVVIAVIGSVTGGVVVVVSGTVVLTVVVVMLVVVVDCVAGLIAIFSFSVMNVVVATGTCCCFRSCGFTFAESRRDMNAVAMRDVTIIFFIMISFPMAVLVCNQRISLFAKEVYYQNQ